MTNLDKYAYSPNALTPANIRKYLRHFGWQEDVYSRTEKAEFWIKKNPNSNEEHDIVLPVHQGFADYGKVVERCLRTLQEMNGNISIFEVYQYIINLNEYAWR
jgi:hypothetical protein